MDIVMGTGFDVPFNRAEAAAEQSTGHHVAIENLIKRTSEE
jgi:hypothetical protein